MILSEVALDLSMRLSSQAAENRACSKQTDPQEPSYLCKLLPFGQPAVDNRPGALRVPADEQRSGLLHLGQQIGIAYQVGHSKLYQPGLARAEDLAGAAQLQILFGDDKTIRALAHDAQALPAQADNGPVHANAGGSCHLQPRNWYNWASPGVRGSR